MLGWMRDRAAEAGRIEADDRVLFLDAAAATSSRLGPHRIREGHRRLCQYFGCGLIDRTGMLDPGFPTAAFDPVPTRGLGEAPASLDGLCVARAQAILDEAGRRDLPVRVLWSGGIDSSAALASFWPRRGPRDGRAGSPSGSAGTPSPSTPRCTRR